MQPKLLNRESFTVLGILTRVIPATETAENYGRIWKKFEESHARIKPHSTDRAYYGVSFPTEIDGMSDYLAGMAVREETPVPEGLVIRGIPAARYAVFETPMQAIGETYHFIFTEWLTESPYDFDPSTPTFEQYPPEGDAESPVLIHIPIRP